MEAPVKRKRARAGVLAFTPTFGNGPRAETLACVKDQVFYGKFVYEVSWENPYPPPDYRNVLAQYVRAREMALAGGYDALWIIEHDMWAPNDALQKLWDALTPGHYPVATGEGGPAGVAYGVYLFRHGPGMLNAWEWRPGMAELPGHPRLAKLGQPLAGYRLTLARQAQITRVSGVGFGCMLIRREVLEQVPFRSAQPDEDYAPDVPFALDCLTAGVKAVAHFGVLCGHWDGVRWRGPLGCALVQGTWVRAKQNVVTMVAGERLELIAGTEYAVPPGDVRQLERWNFVERIERVQ